VTALLACSAAAFGLAVGSFLTVVMARVPAGHSVVSPARRCPACLAGLRWFENIPVLAFVAQGGRCRSCGARIPWRYPALEAVTALAFVALALRLGAVWVLPAFCAYAATAIACAAIDIETRRIPHKVLFPGLALATALLLVGAALDGSADRLVWAAVGGLGTAAFLEVIDLAYAALRGRTGIGFGDVKFMLLLGSFPGFVDPLGPVLALFLAFAAGAVGGAVYLTLWRRDRPRAGPAAIPFGPFLAAGSFLAVLAGPLILDWYLGSLGR